MADLDLICTEVAAALTAAGIRAAARFPDQVQVPQAIVEPENVSWRTAMQRGHEMWTLSVKVLVSAASNRAGQIERNSYFGGAKDVKDAIEAHIPLRDGSAADDVFVAEARNFSEFEVDGIYYIGVEFIVETYA